MFVIDEEVKKTDIGGGVSRKILAYDEKMMAVRVSFERGAIGAVHSHPHTQISYVLNGRFEATVGEDTRVIGAGDTYIAGGGVPHGVVCLEEGELLDVFTPCRKDFLTK